MTDISLDQLLRLGLIVSPLVLFLAALYSRAATRRILAALAAGLASAVLAAGWDRLALALGWWRSPSLAAGVPGPLFYLPAALGFAAASLAGWRLARRWGWRGFVAFLAGGMLAGLAYDLALSTLSTARLLAFGPGPVPIIADMARWASALAAGQAVMRLLAGEAWADRLAGQPTTG